MHKFFKKLMEGNDYLEQVYTNMNVEVESI
jgi:hypothetical protein